jgi:hypothetical protein
MLTCTSCHFATEMDGVAGRTDAGCCSCLRAYGRETGNAVRMPKAPRRELIAALSAVDVA